MTSIWLDVSASFGKCFSRSQNKLPNSKLTKKFVHDQETKSISSTSNQIHIKKERKLQEQNKNNTTIGVFIFRIVIYTHLA